MGRQRQGDCELKTRLGYNSETLSQQRERERERERERGREGGRERQRQRNRETETERETGKTELGEKNVIQYRQNSLKKEMFIKK
jgi:hypothetical protein